MSELLEGAVAEQAPGDHPGPTQKVAAPIDDTVAARMCATDLLDRLGGV